jgi:hypothetical protein
MLGHHRELWDLKMALKGCFLNARSSSAISYELSILQAPAKEASRLYRQQPGPTDDA